MTPELFHGGHTRDLQGRLVPSAGLKDCVSVFGSHGQIDANYAEPAVLATLGISPAVIPAFVERRRAEPFRNPNQLAEFARLGGPGFGRLQLGGGTVYTLRASARILLPNGQLSDLRRDAAAMVKLPAKPTEPAFIILRWYDN